MFLFTLLAACTVAVAAACHPECQGRCNDPRCYPSCDPICQPPVCEYQCVDNSTCAGYTPQCFVRCPADMCESDACPQCETICDPAPLACSTCSPLCEETNCSWQCWIPHTCPYRRRCEHQCEDPACKYSSASTLGVPLLFIVALFLFL